MDKVISKSESSGDWLAVSAKTRRSRAGPDYSRKHTKGSAHAKGITRGAPSRAAWWPTCRQCQGFATRKGRRGWHTQLVAEERGICICVRRLASSHSRRSREWDQGELYFTEQCSYKDNIVSACTHSVPLMHVTVYVSVWERVCVLYNNGRYKCVCAGQVEPKSTPYAWTINSQLLPPH